VTLGRALTIVLVVGALLATAAYRGLQASRAQRTGTLTLAGLEAPVEIRFDARARPYVRAETLGDAFFAQGVLHTLDRLWQMELLSRAGRGRLAEILGPSLLDTDRELWRAGVPQLAARIEANADAVTRERVARYVRGVNAALDQLAARPPELLLARIPLRRWTRIDVYALGAAMAWSSGRNAGSELLRWTIAQTVSPEEFDAFLPDEASLPDFPYIVPGKNALAVLARRDALDAVEQALLPSLSLGSNGWAVAPGSSSSARALFAFDSHDDLPAGRDQRLQRPPGLGLYEHRRQPGLVPGDP
jgi:penicillin amidase